MSVRPTVINYYYGYLIPKCATQKAVIWEHDMKQLKVFLLTQGANFPLAVPQTTPYFGRTALACPTSCSLLTSYG